MGADADINAVFESLWDSTLFRALVLIALVIAVAALLPRRRGR